VSGIDYSGGRPTAQQIRAAGYDLVLRYFGTPGRAKNITRAEFADLVAGGVHVVAVYEASTGDALGGFNAGRAAALAARADADAVGFPRSRPIYFAVDQDIITEAQFTAVMEYLRGAGSVLGGAAFVGVYGEYDVTTRARAAGVAEYQWQTVAWSRGLHDQQADLYQRLGYVYIGSMAADLNDQLQTDVGQFPPPKEDPLSALSDQEQRDLYNRIMGFCRQRWYVIKNGQPFEVSADTPDAIPAHALDTLDGNWLVGQDEQLLAALKAMPVGGDVNALATALAPVLAPLLPAGATPAQVGEAVVEALHAHLAPAATS
jgi:hypothetical protein